jgi:hypothetical protein
MKRSILAVTVVAATTSCLWGAPRETTQATPGTEPKAAALAPAVAGPRVVTDTWDWPAAMQKVTAKFTGTQGVVVHLGDSITYSNGYGQWARNGKGQTPSDKEALKWMHTGDNNDLDGWYLAAFDVPNRGGSYTAVSGMRLDQYLAGGFHDMPPMSAIIKKYNPQVAVLMLGTNDVSAGRPLPAFKADLEKAVKLILDNNTIPVLSTIPPHHAKIELAQEFNKVIIAVAREHKLPLIDFYGQILTRQPENWNGTLLSKNDVHPSASAGEVGAASEPTTENLRKVGYLLRGWLSVQKIKDVKAKAIDPLADKAKAVDVAKKIVPHLQK